MTLFWNRIESQPGAFASEVPIRYEARILSLSTKDNPNMTLLHNNKNNNKKDEMTTTTTTGLPNCVTIVGIGSTMDELCGYGGSSDGSDNYLKHLQNVVKPNVVVVTALPNARQVLKEVLQTFPSIQWVQSMSAGIDSIISDVLTHRYQLATTTNTTTTEKNNDKGLSSTSSSSSPSSSSSIPYQYPSFQITNVKGCFSSTLAEYALLACSYFAKDLPRLLKQQQNKDWNKYSVLELRGSTMGIIGYGDIGRTTARLAKAYGMNIIALKRTRQSHPSQKNNVSELKNFDDNEKDPYCDQMLYQDESSSSPDYDTTMQQLFATSDYILCSLPLTPETWGMITRNHFFQYAKQDSVFINVGRGPIVDELAMIDALQTRRIKGAGLDVVAIEPLPKDSPLWELDNVLLSPHNMDQTATFLQEACEFFVNENLPRFIRGLPLLNPVDPIAGY